MAKYKIIVNPTAGKGMAGRLIPQINEKLKNHGLDYDLVRTEHPWHAADLAQQAIVAGYETVVAVGGDGTANEVLNGIMIAKSAGLGSASMGILPVGRGNDLAYGMGIPANLDASLAVLAEGNKCWMDIGCISGGLYPQGRYFGNGVGIGFDTIVGFIAAELKLTGFAAYLVAALKTMILYYNSPLLEIQYDHQSLTQKCIMVSLMNGKRMGGGFMMAPQSKPNDGFLDLCIASHINQFQVLMLIPRFIKGTQKGHPAINFKQAAHINIQAIEGSLPVHADGETICTHGKEVTLKLLPRQIEFVTTYQELQ